MRFVGTQCIASLQQFHLLLFPDLIKKMQHVVAQCPRHFVDEMLPCGDVNVQVVGDDLVGDVGLPEMFGDGIERGGLHVEAVGLGGQIFQEISGIDVR